MIIAILTIIGTLLMVLIPIVAFAYRVETKLRSYYKIMWKKSSALKPDEVLGTRGEPKHGFQEYYYQRQEDQLIRERIENNQNVLIIGNPLAGKSRAIYQALTTLNKPCDVSIPRLVDINPQDFRFPPRSKLWRKTILLLDDIDKFVDKQNFMFLLQEFMKRNTLIVASCRSGPEYRKLCKRMERELTLVFGDPIEISEISKEEGEEVARQTRRKLPPTFDGNIGSIFLQLDTMRERFRSCNEIEKGILRSIKRLYYAGIYRERENFSIERVKYICKMKEEIEKRHYEWTEHLKQLENKGFVEIAKNEILAEETYLEFVIEDEFSALDNLNEMMDIFSNDCEALLRLGNKANHIGVLDIQKAKYMRVAVEAYEQVLKVFTLEEFPMDYAMTENNLGGAYGRLAEVEDKAENCKNAIKAYKQALKVFTLEKFPIQYAATENNLGGAYGRLAEVEDKAENCKNAIKAYKQALKVFTKQEYPEVHRLIEDNLAELLDFCRGE